MKEKHGIGYLFGDKKFYKMILAVAVPIMIQNGITNFVGLLDNIMVGRVGTQQMSGAAIVNQILFVYNLAIFGGISGAGIFTAQYRGLDDEEGIRNTLRFKLWLGIALTSLTIILLIVKGDSLISLYLQGKGTVEDARAILTYGKEYLIIMLFGLPAFMIGQVYASTLRECGETILPMKAGLVSVICNLVLNYILIYGKLGIPALGVRGAAIATVISRYLESAIIIVCSHKQKESYPYLKGVYRTMCVPRDLVKSIFIKGTPLLINETLWASGMSMLVKCYSVRGLHVVAALNISNTIANVFNIVFLALGDSVAIIIGQLLGANDMEKAKHTAPKMITFSVCCSTGMAVIMFLFAPLFPMLFKATVEVRELAQQFIWLSAAFMPVGAFLHSTYFTLRSGGKTIITFLFDSVFIWTVGVTLATILSKFTALPVLAIYAIVQLSDAIKAVIGFILVKKGVWLQNIVMDSE